MKMIELTNVCKITANGAVPARAVNFEVRAGDGVWLLGKNGSGKTTILEAIAGYLSYDGQIQISNASKGVLMYHGKKKFITELTLGEHLEYWAWFYGATEKNIQDAMVFFECGSWGGRYPHQVSKGQLQRWMLLQLMLADVNIWLLDEPFVHVDSEMKKRILDLIDRHRNNGNAVVVATHEKSVIDQYRMEEVWL